MNRLKVFNKASLCRNFDDVVFKKLQLTPRVSDYSQGRIEIVDGNKRALMLRNQKLKEKAQNNGNK